MRAGSGRGVRRRTNLALLGDVERVDLQHVHARRLVRQRDLDLAVEAAGPQQRRVEHVGPVGRADHLDLANRVEAVQLVEQLHQRPLDLAVSGGALREAAATLVRVRVRVRVRVGLGLGLGLG